MTTFEFGDVVDIEYDGVFSRGIFLSYDNEYCNIAMENGDIEYCIWIENDRVKLIRKGNFKE